MKLFLLFGVSVSLASQLRAEDSANIRPAGEVVLHFERRIEVPEIKRLNEEGVLELFPGDTVHLEFQLIDGSLVDPKVVEAVEHPGRTITFKMKQDFETTILSRSTGIQQTVAFDCVHRLISSREFFPTTLRPTEKGLSSFDSWPNTVWILRLSNIRVTDKSASEVYDSYYSDNDDG